MGDWRTFGYEGKPETCLWCGKKLRRQTVALGESQAVPEGYHLTGSTRRNPWGALERTAAADKLGDYKDDSYCGLRCGYQFGLRMAELGRRLQLQE